MIVCWCSHFVWAVSAVVILSSHEHGMLKLSYWDQRSCDVRRGGGGGGGCGGGGSGGGTLWLGL